jgi:hypothetical protein
MEHMNNENESKSFSSEVIESANNGELNDSILKNIARRILELENDNVNKNPNDDDMKKKIMSIIEEELKCN